MGVYNKVELCLGLGCCWYVVGMIIIVLYDRLDYVILEMIGGFWSNNDNV